MSRAFVKEPDGSEPETLPELPVSPERNLVTVSGLKQIEENIGRYHAALNKARADDDKPEMAKATRDLNYWSARLETAELVQEPDNADEVRFGHTVVLEYEDRRQKKFRIVGLDEADPARGMISYLSPLARNLIGKQAGDAVEVGQGEAEILKIE